MLGQSIKQIEYTWFVFCILSHYCNALPQFHKSTRSNKLHYSTRLTTKSLPCFTELYYMFYVDKVKVIPKDIYNLLTPVALAHLIMGDGSAQQYSLRICTDAYSVPDVVRLMNVLMIRYGLDCTLRFHTPTQPRIHIKQNSMSKLRAIVGPYTCSSMMYKLGKAR